MNCKNCQTNLIRESKFCTKCGAKIITNRITFSSLSEEFFSSFISWDNKFLKTIKHLITKPEEVIGSYINGVRKRYMQPFAFLIIILTIYGIYLYFAKDFLTGQIEELISAQKENVINNGTKNTEVMEKMALVYEKFNKIYYNGLFNHPNLFSFLFIPVSGLVSLIVFRKPKYNFIEHNILFTYANAMYSLIATLLGVIGFVLFSNVEVTSVLTIIFMFVYYGYVFKRVFNLSFLKTIYKSLLYFLLTFFILFIFVIILFIYVFISLQVS